MTQTTITGVLIPMEVILIPMGMILIPMEVILIPMGMILIHFGTLDPVLITAIDPVQTKHEKTLCRKEMVRNRCPKEQVDPVRVAVVLALKILINLLPLGGLEPRA